MTDRTGMGVTIADLVNPDDPQSRTYRQINNAKIHGIPLGALVELENGVRLFVVMRSRDCDGTPLYCLGPDANDLEPRFKGFVNPGWIGGYDEHSLTVVLVRSSLPKGEER